MTNIRKNIKLVGANNRPFLADLYEADVSIKEEIKGVFIFCHGFKGFKDWGAWNLVGKFFASHGYHFVNFNFSHNGTTIDSPLDFADLDAFGRNNYSKELTDLNSVVNWLEGKKMNGELSYKGIHIIGHSRSGPITIIEGLNNKVISSVTTWAGVPNLDYSFIPKILVNWKKNGVRYIPNARTNQEMPMLYQIVEDYYEHEEKLDILQVLKNTTNRPKMHFIHGENDLAISPLALDKLQDVFPESEATLIPNTGHTFRSTHPWEKEFLPESLKEVCIKTLRYIK